MQMRRRDFLALGAGLCCGRCAAEGPPPGGDYRTYRADATILLLGIPIYTRRNVGGGGAAYRVAGTPEGWLHQINFVAGSWPSRARGLNRMGYIHERVREDRSGAPQTECLGFMTASKEESLAQAKAALGKTPGTAAFVAIQTTSREGRFQAAVAGFEASDKSEWPECRRLSQAARSACAGEKAVRHERPHSSEGTFLFSLLRAVRDSSARLTQTYLYSRDQFRLETEKRADPKMGRRLSELGLAPDPQRVYRLSGKTRNLRTGASSTFSLWLDSGSSSMVPLRIEYQPRGFLQLAFEAEPAVRRTDLFDWD